jgi:hypothetical protein
VNTMRISSGNDFAAIQRAAKLNRMINASDSLAVVRGLHPRADAAKILDEMTGRDFAEIVKLAGVRPPSSTTTEAFLGLLKSRCAR